MEKNGRKILKYGRDMIAGGDRSGDDDDDEVGHCDCRRVTVTQLVTLIQNAIHGAHRKEQTKTKR